MAKLIGTNPDQVPLNQYLGSLAFQNKEAAVIDIVSSNTVTATNAVISTLFSGSGASLTSLNAASVTTGTLDNARTTAASANGASTIVSRDGAGSFTANVVTATHVGNGAGLTNIPNSATTAASANGASTIVSRDGAGSFTANVVTATHVGDGSGLTNLNGTNIATGTVPNARTTAASANGASSIVARDAAGSFSANIITASSFSGSGASLTSLNATNVASGTLDNARTTAASANGASTIVARDAAGSFTSNVVTASTFSGSGASLTNLNGTNIATGTVANARTTAASANGASSIVARDGAGSFVANVVTATSFSGDGASLTNLNGTNIASGTVANARTTAASANGASTIVARDAAGSFVANVVTATSFSGSGASLTNLNGANIATGTVPNDRTTAASANGASTIVARDGAGSFSANIVTATTFSGSGASLTNLNGTNIATGTVPNARTTAASANGASTIVARDAAGSFVANVVTATSFSGDGAGLTNLNGTNIASGTVANARTTASSSNGASTIVSRDASGSFTTNGITFTNLYNASGATANTPNLWLNTSYNTTTAPNISIAGATTALSSISLSYWNSSASAKNSLSFGRSRGATVGTFGAVINNTILGSIDFQGDDGNSFSPSSAIIGQAIGTISDGIVPGAILLRTVRPSGGAPVTGLSVGQNQTVFLGGGSPGPTPSRVQIYGNIGLDGSIENLQSSASTNAILNRSVLRRDVGLSHSMFHHWFYSEDSVFTTGTVNYFSTQDAGKGARHTIGTAQGFTVGSGVHGSTTAYGFRGSVDNGTAGGSTSTATISSIELVSNTVTITTSSAHGFANTQTVTVQTNAIPATSMVAGVEYTIVDIGTTDFTLVGALTQAVFNGSITGTTLTVTGLTSGIILMGCTITGSGIGANTQIIGFGTSTNGGPGTYTINNSTGIGDTVITAVHPGTTFIATGAGTGSGTVRHQTDGSGISVTNTGSTTLTYSRTSANIALTSVGGSVIPARRYNLYLDGTANNYISGSTGLGVAFPVAKLDVSGNQTINIVTVAALDIDCSSGNYFTKTINGASTFTFSNVPASRAYGFTLELTHTSGVITWPITVRWPGNTAPTLSTGNTHLFTFITDDGGSRWRGSSLINYQT